MKLDLQHRVHELFVNYAPEYVLEAIVGELQSKADTLGNQSYIDTGNMVQEALITFCRSLPGYENEISNSTDLSTFRPRW